MIVALLYTAYLVAVFEFVLAKPQLWWLALIAWLLNAMVFFAVTRYRTRLELNFEQVVRAAVPLMIVFGLLSASLFFIETSLWRHVVAVLGSVLVGYYIYLFRAGVLPGRLNHFLELLTLVNVLLAAGVGLSLSVFLRIPGYLGLALFFLTIVLFNAHLPGGYNRFLSQARWLPVLVASELFLVALIIPINIFSRAITIGLAFHLVSVLVRTKRQGSLTRKLTFQQVATSVVLGVVVLATSRWI